MNTLTKKTLEKLSELDLDEARISIEKTKDNINVFLMNFNGKEKYIGSKYNGQRDIDSILNEITYINIDTLIIIFGIGSGEYIKEVLEKLSKFNRLLIVEPEPLIIRTFLKMSYSKEILEDERVSLLLFNESHIVDDLTYVIEDETQYRNLKHISFSNYTQLFDESYKKLLHGIEALLTFYDSNVVTEKLLKRDLFVTYLNNLKFIIHDYKINKLKNKLKNIPAIIVSAGPSLEDNIQKLKKVKDNFVIICGNRTLKPLLDEGIIPHFVCAVDNSDLIYDMVKDCINFKVPLVYLETSNNKTITNYVGDRIFFKYKGYETKVEELIGEQVDTLYVGGSVAHVCTDFAAYLGCSPVIFIGQDLALRDKKIYADSAEQGINTNNQDYIQVEDVSGNNILTTRSFMLFKESFEYYFSVKSDTKFINSSNGGAKIKGTEFMALSDVISDYWQDNNISNILKEIFSERINVDYTKVLNLISEYIMNLESLQRDLVFYIKKCDEILNLKEEKDILTEIVNLYNLNDKIEKSSALEFVTILVDEIFVEISSEFSYKESESKVENVVNITKAFKKLYEKLYETIEYAVPLIEDTYKELNEKRNNN